MLGGLQPKPADTNQRPSCSYLLKQKWWETITHVKKLNAYSESSVGPLQVLKLVVGLVSKGKIILQNGSLPQLITGSDSVLRCLQWSTRDGKYKQQLDKF